MEVDRKKLSKVEKGERKGRRDFGVIPLHLPHSAFHSLKVFQPKAKFRCHVWVFSPITHLSLPPAVGMCVFASESIFPTGNISGWSTKVWDIIQVLLQEDCCMNIQCTCTLQNSEWNGHLQYLPFALGDAWAWNSVCAFQPSVEEAQFKCWSFQCHTPSLKNHSQTLCGSKCLFTDASRHTAQGAVGTIFH